MDKRLQFVARRLAGEPMADLCREFGISRKTGYKIFERYRKRYIRAQSPVHTNEEPAFRPSENRGASDPITHLTDNRALTNLGRIVA